jgi:GNAT superfamily N-acetyltransferase
VPDDAFPAEDSGAIAAVSIQPVGPGDLDELLSLMRAYCDFYAVDPPDASLLALSRALLVDPEHEGVQLIARERDGAALGFATVYWTWSTARAGRVGVMNDLFVIPEARGRRVGERLIEACVARCRERGAIALEWETALDNRTAQALYDRLGARQERWLTYSLSLSP